jgi:hypothetical protein
MVLYTALILSRPNYASVVWDIAALADATELQAREHTRFHVTIDLLYPISLVIITHL